MYSITYSERQHVSSDGVLGTIECLSQNSPPTTVTWTRDGSTIQVYGQGYEMMQIVTERQSYSRYNNVLLIKDAFDLAGNHQYCCRISNYAGTSSSECVATTWSGQHSIQKVMLLT